ncbi:mannose-P-dolichol utilization defect 1 protein-like [Aulostomus maculatus]
MATSPFKEFLVSHLMPEKCYERLVVNWQLHVPCLTFVLNKSVSVWIVLDIFLAQLLQLLKIAWRGSADGLSLTAVLLQLYSFSYPVVYVMANNFPLFAWGERLFMVTQTATTVFLILHYRGDTLKGLLLLSAYSSVMFLLGSYASAALISVFESSSLLALLASKVAQAVTNHSNGHTGQLSSPSVFLTWAASLGLSFVALQDTGSSLTLISHILSAALSCVLLAQVLCYRRCRRTPKEKSK